MEISLNTNQIDASVVVKAYEAYKKGDFTTAINKLIDILDTEPSNWHARLFLAASYFKSNQLASAQRAFRYIYEKCQDAEVKKKACSGLQATNSRIQDSTRETPPEFGSYVERMPQTRAILDF